MKFLKWLSLVAIVLVCATISSALLQIPPAVSYWQKLLGIAFLSTAAVSLNTAMHFAKPAKGTRYGLLFRLGSLWIGAHWSRENRRWCINVVPCVTLWITLPGGVAP